VPKLLSEGAAWKFLSMNKKIAILRGINVGGKRKILMADLKLLF